ncbi:hypothetical protein PC116_g5845 [Phytophthora cactorum]|uniref:Uncharacterized protein n=1 Tax=Phytophthora cactorum TaxID=29920 RepID=A0A329SIG0_9STRA|nr:hypothetical protein Pcac1_g5430 [Phytophthora cactorum]KAG2813011.1 hypothetical protein PC111_g14565 [Phytophthora cactorum]KAG2835285.1 hypothetical protein PC112_g5763 [Phytophthora cactorum]KAG2863494.1 hypothetical protein PC113_g5408 [Phytophthora cactorum]KAG2892110.1 hypothetical protein PC114_g16741 [Phytophthora cactorum]
MVDEDVTNGFPSDDSYNIVSKRDIWRLYISDDSPARLTPFMIRLKDGAQPCRCKPRKWGLPRERFSENSMKTS